MKKTRTLYGLCAITACPALFLTISLISNTAFAKEQQQSLQVQPTISSATSTAAAYATTTIVSTVRPVSDPVLLAIPKIAVNAPIKALGLTSKGAMAVPENFVDVGWYGPGTVPGTIGNAVFGAHVDNGTYNPTKNGVFKNLHTLLAGDDIYVIDSNGTVLHFKVTSTEVLPYNSSNTSAIFGSTNTSHLNIITCYGTWTPSIGTYNERFIVFSTLVKS